MIFLDTCVWIELLGVRTPVEPHEVRQARAASALLSKTLAGNETILTCKEQMLELISAIEKVTMRTVNKTRKQNQQPRAGSLKKFRMFQEFQATKELCAVVIADMQHLLEIDDLGEYDIDFIVNRLELADLNDCLYYDYCIEKNVEFYTFDADMARLGNSEILHILHGVTGMWN